MKIRMMHDGSRYAADTSAELVTRLHEGSWVKANDDWEWMEDTAKRVYEQTGAPVRFGSPDDFIADLLKAGVIEELH
jgi:hypothetical protein